MNLVSFILKKYTPWFNVVDTSIVRGTPVSLLGYQKIWQLQTDSSFYRPLRVQTRRVCIPSGGKLVHICTMRRYKLSKKSKRSDWWRQVGSEGRNGKLRVCAFWQCAGWWVCDACNAFNQVHECMSTVNILKSRGIFPAAKTLLTWVKQTHIWLTSTTCVPTKIYTLTNRCCPRIARTM